VRIEVTIPSILRDCVPPGDRARFELALETGATLARALQELQQRYSLLRAHVWDDHGRLRPHVLIFLNDTGVRWMKSLDVPLQEGDRIQIVQAVSGG